MKVIPKSGIFIFGFFCLVLGGICGYMISQGWIMDTYTDVTSVRQSGYEFINPLVECETDTIDNNQKYLPFEKELTRKIEEIENAHPDTHLSLYFRNLKNGPWFGINENASFSPASLMKLPILLMYLKWKEEDPNILQRGIIVNDANTISQEYPPEEEIQVGSGYLISDLLYHLIVYSDNTASNNLIKYVPERIQDMVFNDLGIPLPRDIDYALSVKEYASFFRILYNASYLTRENSEIALKLLSESKFHNGLTGKIPSDIVVAHKFGEREMIDENGNSINQLHDCGIVYYTPYPYLICIMTRGSGDIESLSEIVQDTSKTIYDEVSQTYPQ